MKIAPIAINSAEQLVLSDEFWTHSKMLVSAVATQDLTNEQKHKKVYECLFILIGDIGQTALDIGIKIAVLWFKQQATK
ncbi:MAG: hypothetical protein WC714_28595 [Candidatus Obscuribacterales bacterium]|jgi:hypothetical protein